MTSFPAEGALDRIAGSVVTEALNVLIAEDAALIALDLRLSVEAARHRVVAIVRTADAAVRAVDRARPDAVLMDLTLASGSSGADAPHELLVRHGLRSIFISGNLDLPTRERLADLHPVAMLNKPFVRNQLEAALARHWEERG